MVTLSQREGKGNMVQNVGRRLIQVLVIVLIIGFMGFGISDILRPPSNPPVIEVEGESVRLEAVRSAVQQREQQVTMFTGRPPSPFMRREMVYDTVEKMTYRLLLEAEAKRLGLRPAHAQVLAELRTSPMFHGEDGQFSPERYKQLLAQNNMSEAQLVDMLKKDIAVTALVQLAAGGARLPAPVEDALLGYYLEKRLADYVVLKPDLVADWEPPAPQEAELTAYYEENQDMFRQPEYRSFSYLLVTPESLAGRLAVTEEELQTAYASQYGVAADGSAQEKAPVRYARQLILPEKSQAEAARKRLDAGEDFSDLAQEYAMDPERMELGRVTRDSLGEEIGDVIFALDEGAYSEPVESPFGWHIFSVDSPDEGDIPDFAAVKDELEQGLKAEKTQTMLHELSVQMEDALAGGATIEEIAAQFDLSFQSVDRVTQTASRPDGTRVSAILEPSTLLETVFTLQPGDAPHQVTLPDGGFFYAALREVEESRILPLAEARDRVIVSWKQSRREEKLKEKAQQVAQELQKGRKIEEIAEELGVKVMATPPLRPRRQARVLLPASMQARMFEIEKGGVLGPETIMGGAYAVAQLRDIVPGDAAKSEEATGLRDQLEQWAQQDLTEEYIGLLRRRLDVRIHQDVLAPLMDSGE